MDNIWDILYKKAKEVQYPRNISKMIEAGSVASAIESASGGIYVGVCVDTACSLGICAERNAIFNMITNGESKVRRIVAIMPDGKCGAPCGACRELLIQLMPDDYKNIEIMLDYDTKEIITLDKLAPKWWI